MDGQRLVLVLLCKERTKSMNVIPTADCYVFVIKTDSHAGNFWRQMCGYATGEIGVCGVGAKEAANFKVANPCNRDFEDMIMRFYDDELCLRPVSMWGDQDCDVAIFFETLPTDAQLGFVRERARQFAFVTNPEDDEHDSITISGFELRRYTVTHKNESIVVW